MSAIRTFAFALGLLLLSSLGAEGEELPTSLTCRSNAKASRDYDFAEKRWERQQGQSMLRSARLFKIETRDSKVADTFYSLRDKVFSGLNTSTPVVRSITRFPDGADRGEEFVSRVVTRTNDAVFLLWTNDFNKTWIAALDLGRRKAALAEVFQGVTSVGGELETLDCQ
ncbi:MAG TPA: hypothetical protein VGQ71_08395 [Terriglobales bacterium]|jgi:hypothetical protein|nr:hypothetical protein [Terriglobales bacterium]